MHLSIAERLKPFDHNPGTKTVLPNTNWCVEVFPALISIYDLSCSEPKILSQISVSLKGPLLKFTVQLNLEKGHLLVFGESSEGFFRYSLRASSDEQGLLISVEKPNISFDQTFGKLKLDVSHENLVNLPQNFERLSLGNHKAQDWELVKRRSDLKEILPLWLRLGQSVKSVDFVNEGTASCLAVCKNLIEKKEVNHIAASFETLFKTGFHSLMVPSLFDQQHQGIEFPAVSSSSSPICLLSEGAKLIRSCFLTFDLKTLSILQALPVEFHSGRFLHFQAKNLGIIDLEWSKKIIRRMILFADINDTIDLKLQKEIKRFRLKEESETTSHWIPAGSSITVEKGKTYFFDRFEK